MSRGPSVCCFPCGRAQDVVGDAETLGKETLGWQITKVARVVHCPRSVPAPNCVIEAWYIGCYVLYMFAILLMKHRLGSFLTPVDNSPFPPCLHAPNYALNCSEVDNYDTTTTAGTIACECLGRVLITGVAW